MSIINSIPGFVHDSLYIFGQCMGWTYKEASVIVCIRWWPAFCLISTLPIIAGLIVRILKDKKRWLSLYLLLPACIYTLLYWRVIQSINMHYPVAAPFADNYYKLWADLEQIAQVCNTTYNITNAIIYGALFLLIMLVNGLLTYLAFPKLRKGNV